MDSPVFSCLVGEMSLTAISCHCAVRGLLHGMDLPEHVRKTCGTDPMARLARNTALLELPPDGPLTPGTFDQVIALAQRRDLLADFSVLCLKIEMRCGPLVSFLQHIGTCSSPKVCTGGQPLTKRRHIMVPLEGYYLPTSSEEDARASAQYGRHVRVPSAFLSACSMKRYIVGIVDMFVKHFSRFYCSYEEYGTLYAS